MTAPRRRLLAVGVALVLVTTVAVVLARFGPAVVGDLVGNSCTTLTSDEAADAARVPVGISPGFVVLNDSQADLRRDLDALEDLGVTRIRVDLSWAVLQPGPDRFDWSSADRVLDEARERGLHVLGVVGYVPGWARDVDEAGRQLAVDATAFAGFVALAAARYADRVDAWEIWNEPNTQRFWGARPDPVAYAAVVAEAAPEIRAADPGAPVVVGSIAPAEDRVTTLSPATFVTGLYDELDLADFDAISVHPYTYPDQPTDTEDFNTFFRLEELHRIMTGRGDGDSLIWLTEYGAPTGTADGAVPEEEQAALITAGIREARRRDYVGPLYVYSLRDTASEPADREANFGVLRADRTPKAAYDALADEIGGCR